MPWEWVLNLSNCCQNTCQIAKWLQISNCNLWNFYCIRNFLSLIEKDSNCDSLISLGTMMTSSNGNIFSLLAICAGIHRSPVNSPHKGQLTHSFDVFFDLRLNDGWVNNREAGDLKGYHAHYDVIVITLTMSQVQPFYFNDIPMVCCHSLEWKCMNFD